MGILKRNASRKMYRDVLPRLLYGAALLAATVFMFAAPAAARELKIQKFSAEIFVQQDSALNVTETIEANFIGSWHGLYRSIPIEYESPCHSPIKFASIVSVTFSAGSC